MQKKRKKNAKKGLTKQKKHKSVEDLHLGRGCTTLTET